MEGKVCVITGASRGAGKGIAEVLARNGAYCVVVARSAGQLEQLLNSILENGGKGMCAPCNIADRASVQAMVKKVVDEVGVPDFLINNAGVWAFQDFCDKEYDSWDLMIDVNVKGHLHLMGEFVPLMKERGKGHIINVTSDSERVPFAGVSVYTGTKFFMRGTCEALRMELRGTGVRITNILPGFIWTDGLEKTLNNEKERAMMEKFGFGDPDNYIKNKDLMLQPSDIGDCVLSVARAPENYHIDDIRLMDKLQNTVF
ncbi:uncharacterized protein LOC111700213 [Eurytemora carolleeae]|uniref:uncharacterized protein LOC111700213 n=1 Tax=Eurytemora carolleeae TaxID=1294199 RepID=UPI000C781A0A|nr:uncharacterized protein LOC111700213 [Eurytemora carolleeae]|eukprot:XP_023326845.1 uncharacterized protein LOC111700213 [Eurytemora affinis]